MVEIILQKKNIQMILFFLEKRRKSASHCIKNKRGYKNLDLQTPQTQHTHDTSYTSQGTNAARLVEVDPQRSQELITWEMGGQEGEPSSPCTGPQPTFFTGHYNSPNHTWSCSIKDTAIAMFPKSLGPQNN